MASKSWYDKITDKQRQSIETNIDSDVSWMCEMYNTLRKAVINDDNRLICPDDAVYYLFSSFQYFLTAKPFKPFTAKECYVHASLRWKNEPLGLDKLLAFLSSLTVKDNWMIMEEKSEQFLYLGNIDFWRTKTGRARIICSVIQAAKVNCKNIYQSLKLAWCKMIDDFAGAFGISVNHVDWLKQKQRFYSNPIVWTSTTDVITQNGMRRTESLRAETALFLPNSSSAPYKTLQPVQTSLEKTTKETKMFSTFGIDDILRQRNAIQSGAISSHSANSISVGTPKTDVTLDTTRPCKCFGIEEILGKSAPILPGAASSGSTNSTQPVMPMPSETKKAPHVIPPKVPKNPRKRPNTFHINPIASKETRRNYAAGTGYQSPILVPGVLQQIQAFQNQTSPSAALALMSIAGLSQPNLAALPYNGYTNPHK